MKRSSFYRFTIFTYLLLSALCSCTSSSENNNNTEEDSLATRDTVYIIANPVVEEEASPNVEASITYESEAHSHDEYSTPSSHWEPEEEIVQCPLCYGLGTCGGGCGGGGVVYRAGDLVDCPACNGTGACQYCNGSGYTKQLKGW